MKKIIFVTDTFKNMPTANGICVEEIIGQFEKSKYEIHVLCFKRGKEPKDEFVDGIYIHRMRVNMVNRLRYAYESRKKGMLQTVYKNLMKILNRLETALFIWVFPMRNPLFSWGNYNRLAGLHIKYNFDAVVASYCPFEAIYAAYKLKKKFNTKTILYFLDSMSNQKFNVNINLPEGLLDDRGWKWEQRFFESCDLILNMMCHEKHYMNQRYEMFFYKMETVDIPHIIDHGRSDENANEKTEIKIVYAGLIRENLIKDTFQVLTPFLIKGMVQLHIYGRSTISEAERYCNEEARNSVFFEGAVSHEEMLKIEANASILLSIGNTDMDFVPSKIFEYMSFGGKILHIYNCENDSSLPYLRKYPNSCCVDVREATERNIKKIEFFLDLTVKRTSFESIERLFYRNTPRFTAQKIKLLISDSM